MRLYVCVDSLRTRSRQTETYTEERTHNAQDSVTKGLDHRLSSTLEVRSHLHHAITDTINELALQDTMKTRLQVREDSLTSLRGLWESLVDILMFSDSDIRSCMKPYDEHCVLQ